ncbi:unnamed protein product [Trichobilharzia szidati]|nr:unnamed protein product [Trichobilharzia szidati]
MRMFKSSNSRNVRKSILAFSVGICTTLLIIKLSASFQSESRFYTNSAQNEKPDDNPRHLPLIFIGGHQSSGTGLLRILMDIHPLVRCGPEPIVTREIITYRLSKNRQNDRLLQSGISQDVLDNAVAGFIVSILQNMGPPAERLCHKDPGSYFYLKYLGDLFQNAKFIHIVRDGRAAVASTIARKINPQFRSDNITQALKYWEAFTSHVISDCEYIGRNRCLTIRYECLVLNPKEEISKLLKFLDLPWDDRLLQHEKYIHNVSMLNKYEASSVQVVKPIHLESLTAWCRNGSVIPKEYISTMHKESRLLKKLGYATNEIPPNYENLCKVDSVL